MFRFLRKILTPAPPVNLYPPMKNPRYLAVHINAATLKAMRSPWF